MNKIYVFRLIVLISLFLANLAHANNDSYVTDWTQKTLIETLTASYLTTPEETAAIQRKYSHSAWEPMNDFFNKELKMIDDQKLSIHPKALTQPVVERVAKCISVHCWRVTQSYKLPELHMNINFSLLVVSTSPASESPFLIQSVDMKVQHY